MLNNVLKALLLLAAISLGNSIVQAQTTAEPLPDNVPALLVKANEAYGDGDYILFRDSLLRLREMRPNNGEYMYQLVIAYALLDDKSSAYDLMLRMQQQGLSYDFNTTSNSLNIRGTEVFDYVNDLMKMAGTPVGESEVVFTLPETVLRPDSIRWDETRQKFLVGTLATGAIIAVAEDGQVSELLKADNENGMWSVFDMLIDPARNRLWVSSAATGAFEAFSPVDKGRSALFEFNLETLELVHRYPVPVDGRPHILGSMVLANNGDILIADRALPILYRKAADEKKLKAVIASKDLISMRGLAIEPDGRRAYVADREMGIMVVDFDSQKAGILAVAATLNLGGIDGLFFWNKHLIIIQNGIKPQRVMRLELDDTGTRVISVRPLAVAQEYFDFPSFGTIKGEELYYFANSQWSGSKDNKPVTVLRTPLDSNKDLVVPDMQEYLRQREEKMRNKK